MPRKPVTSKKKGSRNLTFDQEAELVIGCGGERSHFENEEQKRKAWEYHKQIFSRSSPPGRRLEIWWKYDAPEPKRIIGKKSSDKYHRTDFDIWDSDNFRDPKFIYEDDISYLKRLNLLEKWEIAELKKRGDWNDKLRK